MKRLRDKKTGETYKLKKDMKILVPVEDKYRGWRDLRYDSLEKLYEDLEDYEAATEKSSALGMMILTLAGFIENEPDEDKVDLEDCKQMLGKLKALKRLKDEGMRIYSFKREKSGIDLDYYTLTILAPRDKDSLDLLFGGKE